MRNKESSAFGPGVLDVAEEAVELLLRAPWSVLLRYFLGTIPFVAFGLYAFGELSFNPTGESFLPLFACTAALLYIWMKYHQSAFMAGLLAFHSGNPPPARSIPHRFRAVLLHAFVQPIGQLMMMLGFLFVFPFMRISALFNYITLLLSIPAPSFRMQFNTAVNASGVRPQRHLALNWLFHPWFLGAAFLLVLIVLPILIHGFKLDEYLYYLLTGLIVFLAALSSPLGALLYGNITAVLFLLPGLILTFSGIENAFTRLGSGLFSTLFFATAFVLTFLILDPLMKSIYVILFFHDSSRTTGEDLRTTLRRITRPVLPLLLLSILVPVALSASPSPSDLPTPDATRSASLEAYVASFDESLRREMSDPDYLWKLDRDYAFVPDNVRQLNAVTRFLGQVYDVLSKWFEKIRNVIRKLRDWWHDLITPDMPNASATASGGSISQSELAAFMLAAATVLLAFLLIRVRRRMRRIDAPDSVDIHTPEEPESDAERAAALPESDWIEAAERLLCEGDRRGALRAFYYAVLACLATMNLLVLARHKVDREYLTELRRRAEHKPGLESEFRDVVYAFQAFRYGDRDVTVDGIERFRQLQETVRRHAST